MPEQTFEQWVRERRLAGEMSVRAENVLLSAHGNRSGRSDFVLDQPFEQWAQTVTELKLRRVKNLGKRSVEEISRLLAGAGYPLPKSKAPLVGMGLKRDIRCKRKCDNGLLNVWVKTLPHPDQITEGRVFCPCVRSV